MEQLQVACKMCRGGLMARLADPVRWQIVEQGRQNCSWPVGQQLVDLATDHATQGSSVGK